MPRIPQPCGTSAAYRAHKRRGEEACEECRAANAAYTAAYRAKQPKKPPRALKPCGTVAAYQRHLRHGEAACAECRAANAAYSLGSKAKSMLPKTVVIAVRCPMCASDVVEENRRQMRSELVSIVRCTHRRCGYRFVARLVVVPVRVDELGGASKCGTESGYARHRRAGEEPCEACRLAHAERKQSRKAAA